jgi:RNA polymerase-binding transcription factor DksA
MGRSGRAGAARVERLEGELRRTLERLGASEATVVSVMQAGCRLDGVGAAGLAPELAEATIRLRNRARELAAALDRAASGGYGVCDGCGGTIDEARLDLLPTTTRCRRCVS